MAETPPSRRRRSLIGNTGSPAPTRRVAPRPEPTLPGFAGVIPDGSEPADPVTLRRLSDEGEPPRPTLMPPLDDPADDPDDADDDAVLGGLAGDETVLMDPGERADLIASHSGAVKGVQPPPDRPAPWVLGAILAAVILLGIGLVGGASAMGFGVALFGEPTQAEPGPMPIALPTPADEAGAQPAADAEDAAPPVDPEAGAAAPADETDGDEAEKGLKVRLPKIKLGKKKGE